MGKSKIEWTEVTWNPVLGCSKVSEGCRNCYAMSMSARIANAAAVKEENTEVEKAYQNVVPRDQDGKYLPKWNNKIALVESRLDEPLRWQKPRMVFVNSMSDLFHPDVPFEFVDKVFAVMADADKHIFQILTKRPDRMAEYLSQYRKDFHPVYDFQRMVRKGWPINDEDSDEYPLCHEDDWPLKNVWLGTSIENQETTDERILHLLRCPAAVRFLSMEPLLGPVNLKAIHHESQVHSDDTYSLMMNALSGFRATSPCSGIDGPSIDWVIVGGESGPNARPMHPDWARSLRDQCVEADVAFFMKQWGAWRVAKPDIDSWKKVSIVPPDGSWTESSGQHMKSHSFISAETNQKPMIKVGKKKAGRELDGRQWNQMPDRNEA